MTVMSVKQQRFYAALLIASAGVALFFSLRLVGTSAGIYQQQPGWLVLLGLIAVGIWSAMAWLAEGSRRHSGLVQRLTNFAVPLLFALAVITSWQLLVVGFSVSKILLPAPSDIAQALVANLNTLGKDFVQTWVKAVLVGWLVGCCSGFLLALWVDRSPFLYRGLLPIANVMCALPIVGIAPIMVMWFGFDWQSKAAVVVAMTFFPMLVNTLSGLKLTDKLHSDLLNSYAASWRQRLWFVQLPTALPFIFNALKLNSTLALVGAIVAEFFGTPIVGLGFRISTEVGRMNMDIVWAAILVAAIAGTLSYGLLALLESRLTFWRSSTVK